MLTGMAWRPTWPDLLTLIEELRFQIAVVVLVLAVGAAAVAVSLPRPDATISTAAPAATSLATAAPSLATAVASLGATVAGPEATATRTAIAESSPTPALAVPIVRTPARPATIRAGERARLVVPVPIRLACNEAQAPLGVLLSGTTIDVIEVGTASCADWLLVDSTDGLTWLHPSALAPIEVAAGP